MLLNLCRHTSLRMNELVPEIRKRLNTVYDSSEADWLVRCIMEDVCGMSRADMLVKDIKIPAEKKRRAEQVVARLMQREPYQYITGRMHFCGIPLYVSPSVLIPRPETAELVCRIAARECGNAPLRILDLCTGSGCIAVALAKKIRDAEFFAADISAEALEVARRNARENGVGVKFAECDIFGDIRQLPSNVDVIVSNPPYVTESEKKDMDANVLCYEPHRALFVPDEAPLLFYRRIADIGHALLSPQGRLYLEINSAYAGETARMLEQKGYSAIEIRKDFYNNARFIECVLKRTTT